MGQFDIIRYLSGLTGFVFDRDVLERIAMDNGVAEVTSYDELEQKDKDLLLADLLFTAYVSPNTMASSTRQHGAYTYTVGSQTIQDKKGIYEMMAALYKKYGKEEKLALIAGGNLQWME